MRKNVFSGFDVLLLPVARLCGGEQGLGWGLFTFGGPPPVPQTQNRWALGKKVNSVYSFGSYHRAFPGHAESCHNG